MWVQHHQQYHNNKIEYDIYWRVPSYYPLKCFVFFLFLWRKKMCAIFVQVQAQQYKYSLPIVYSRGEFRNVATFITLLAIYAYQFWTKKCFVSWRLLRLRNLWLQLTKWRSRTHIFISDKWMNCTISLSIATPAFSIKISTQGQLFQSIYLQNGPKSKFASVF